MSSKTIIFYAPVGTGLPSHKLGGGERGCRRTLEILENNGYKVLNIDKPIMAKGIVNYIKMALIAYLKLIKLLLTNKQSILYIVGFYERNVYLEWINIITGKLLNHKIIYEARNGRLVKAYYEYGKLYKRIMDSILKTSDIIFCQGLEYVDFIKENYKKKSVYTPNYVMNRYITEYNTNRTLDIIKLIYFGRITESKNIEVIIEVYAELISKGYDTNITIIGGYSEEYKSVLDNKIKSLKIPKHNIKFLGQQPFEKISNELQNAHFFIFPSQEAMEGHSNSLTEAMTFGVVPVVSTAGFNSSIVSKPELVVDMISSNKFCNVIDKIIKDKSWEFYSKYVYDRVKQNYTEDIVRESILKEISKLTTD